MKTKIFGNIFDRLLVLMFVFAGVLLVFSMLIISLGVASRYFLGRPMGWVSEIVEYSLVYIAFLSAPLVLKREGHVRMDLLLERLSPRSQALLNMITSGICSVICFILFWFGVRVTFELFQTNYTTPTVLELPKFIFVAIIFIGSMALCLQFIIRIFGFISSWRAAQPEKEDS